MKKAKYLFLAFFTTATFATDISHSLLSTLDTHRQTWKNLDSELAYLYIGSSPREMSLGLPLQTRPSLPLRLKDLIEPELDRIRKTLKLSSAEFEAWPAFDDWGELSWMVTRYRENPAKEWKWLDGKYAKPKHREGAGSPTTIVLPDFLDPNESKASDQIFNQLPDDVYQRPTFETTVWLKQNRKEALGGWFHYDSQKDIQAKCREQSCTAATVLPPAHFNDDPIAFVFQVDRAGVHSPPNINWVKENRSHPIEKSITPAISEWPASLKENYLKDLKRLTGETPIRSPLTGKVIDFNKQSSSQADNQLMDTVHYLKKRHEALGYGKKKGFELEVQNFEWQGMAQANLIARIIGKNNTPVVISGHFDKAISEDLYETSKHKDRITTPGADDNITSVAAMLAAAAVFAERYKNTPPDFDIILLYDTGEEFPAGTIGARYFVNHDFLQKGKDIKADINLDMIGYRTDKSDKVYQICPGSSEGSWPLAELALSVAKLSPTWQPEVRFPWAKTSYLVQTSGAIFDWAGYPVILINEHINLAHRINPHYHQSTDIPKHVDLNYAIAQTKTMIETAVRVAERLSE